MQVVDISTSRPYSVYIGRGLYPRLCELLSKTCAPGKAAILSDTNVFPHFGDAITKSLSETGFEVFSHLLSPGEGSKSMGELTRLLEALAARGLGRDDLIIALGGGTVSDLAGFAASVYMRGINYVNLPTTLLAASDSSVGGKTAVNLTSGKNLAGSFWQPAAVFIDLDFLSFLPRRELSSGAAECIKCGMLFDEGLFCSLSEKGFESDWEAVIASCVRHKAEIVASDERDEGERALLNLGHSFGHAAEKLSAFALSHGEAVAMGMLIACRAAEKMDICEKGVSERLVRALEAFSLPVTCPYSPQELSRAALSDKKLRGGTLSLVLPRRVGECILYPIEAGRLAEIAWLGTEPGL